ncbi:MAG TPA: type II toxin-antitoxin system RelE/ParE family toxin [Fimbriimonadaceae bacterium]
MHNTAGLAAEDEIKSRAVVGHPTARAVFVKWSKAKHGHYIAFRLVEGGIYVTRILHGAMDLPKHL